MLEVLPDSREDMNAYAPRVHTIQINPEYIRSVIGKGGEVIQGLQAEHDVQIDIQDDGMISVTAQDKTGAEGALKAIKDIAYEPEIGDVFEDAIVKNVMDFGAFVEFLPRKEALVHVSEISDERVENVSDVLSEGQKVKVKLIGIDDKGRIKLSMKQAK
jgi:polyribonucleotide nucleotidyltransferase